MINIKDNKNEINKEQSNKEKIDQFIQKHKLANINNNYIKELPDKVKNKIFILFLLSNLFVNYDGGVIAVSLLEIIKEIPLDYKEQALLGSLAYLGLSFISLFTSPIINKFGASKIITFTLFFNSFCCFVFAFTNNKSILFFMRFCMGITEAFVVIYGPVWVNNYSPKRKSTLWLGLLNSCTIFGMISGYIIAGFINNLLSNLLTWRFALDIQGIALIPISILFLIEDSNNINIDLEIEESYINNMVNRYNIRDIQSDLNRNNINIDMYSFSQRHIDNNPISEGLSRRIRLSPIITDDSYNKVNNITKFILQAKYILTTPIYLCTILSLCSIYFIVTGIQFWMTAYLIKVIKTNPMTVVVVFSITAVTAPLAGVLIGGIISDKFGGYKGKNTLKAIKMCSSFGFISVVFSFPLCFLFSFFYITVLLWTFLFFGAAIVPIATGISISSIRKECQVTSSSLSQLIYNLFGYFLSPILTGCIMDCFKDKREGFIWGMRVNYSWTLVAMIGLLLGWYYISKDNTNKNEQSNELSESDEDNIMENDLALFIRMEIWRRMIVSAR